MPRRSAAQVAESRRAILDAAVAETSVRGFEAATIGHLAAVTGFSKSGLIRHFGDKQELQLATFEAAITAFVEEVWRPVEQRPAGRLRLLDLCDAWLDFFQRRVFPGGCVMTTALVEFDARDGKLHDSVAGAMALWLTTLERELRQAVANGELPPDSDPADLAFAINAIASAASTHHHLTGDPAVLERARRLVRRTLHVAT